MKRLFLAVLVTLGAAFFLANPFYLTEHSQEPLKKQNGLNMNSTIPEPSQDIPVYSVYLTDLPSDRYKQIITDKKVILGQFIDYLYQISNFKYSMWLAKILFTVLPQKAIRNHLGQRFFDQCKGISLHSQRQLYQIVVYNYMYEIGAAQDFCTSIAITQTKDDEIQHKQNLSLLARNLDYGFQQYLVSNTVKINFYHNRTSTKPLFTTMTHAGFVSTHTLLKYETETNLQFGLTLNQRKSQNIISTLKNIIATRCESVFQLTNRLLTTDLSTIEQLIQLVSNSKQKYFQLRSCSRFYFIVQAKNGDHVVVEKNEGVGVHRVYFEKAVDFDKDPFFILQTNTDRDQKDPDGRRDQAISKMNKVIEKGFVQRQDVKRILLEAPNFNEQTLMTALIDVEKGEIDAIVWSEQAARMIKQIK